MSFLPEDISRFRALERAFETTRRRVDKALVRFIGRGDPRNKKLYDSVLYSIRAGGKRLRHLLVLASARVVARRAGAGARAAMSAACAREMIHTYSLIHDDLPAMDDDDLRRGKPTNHKVFGDAVAILAGDALHTLAFKVLGSTPGISAERIVRMVRILSDGAGIDGMVGGQAADIQTEGTAPTPRILQYIHDHKTRDLIRAATLLGAVAGGGNEGDIRRLAAYGNKIGLAFQVVDDIIGVIGDAKEMGKAVGSDAARKKMTYPALYGIEKSRAIADRLIAEAKAALRPYGARASLLRDLADYILVRTK